MQQFSRGSVLAPGAASLELLFSQQPHAFSKCVQKLPLVNMFCEVVPEEVLATTWEMTCKSDRKRDV